MPRDRKYQMNYLTVSNEFLLFSSTLPIRSCHLLITYVTICEMISRRVAHVFFCIELLITTKMKH